MVISLLSISIVYAPDGDISQTTQGPPGTDVPDYSQYTPTDLYNEIYNNPSSLNSISPQDLLRAVDSNPMLLGNNEVMAKFNANLGTDSSYLAKLNGNAALKSQWFSSYGLTDNNAQIDSFDSKTGIVKTMGEKATTFIAKEYPGAIVHADGSLELPDGRTIQNSVISKDKSGNMVIEGGMVMFPKKGMFNEEKRPDGTMTVKNGKIMYEGRIVDAPNLNMVIKDNVPTFSTPDGSEIAIRDSAGYLQQRVVGKFSMKGEQEIILKAGSTLFQHNGRFIQFDMKATKDTPYYATTSEIQNIDLCAKQQNCVQFYTDSRVLKINVNDNNLLTIHDKVYDMVKTSAGFNVGYEFGTSAHRISRVDVNEIKDGSKVVFDYERRVGDRHSTETFTFTNKGIAISNIKGQSSLTDPFISYYFTGKDGQQMAHKIFGGKVFTQGTDGAIHVGYTFNTMDAMSSQVMDLNLDRIMGKIGEEHGNMISSSKRLLIEMSSYDIQTIAPGTSSNDIIDPRVENSYTLDFYSIPSEIPIDFYEVNPDVTYNKDGSVDIYSSTIGYGRNPDEAARSLLSRIMDQQKQYFSKYSEEMYIYSGPSSAILDPVVAEPLPGTQSNDQRIWTSQVVVDGFSFDIIPNPHKDDPNPFVAVPKGPIYVGFPPGPELVPIEPDPVQTPPQVYVSDTILIKKEVTVHTNVPPYNDVPLVSVTH